MTSTENAGSPLRQSGYHHRNRRVIIPDGMMAVGLVVGVHGLRGEVKVEPHTDFPERFAAGNTLLMGVGLMEMRILASRPHKGLYLVLFDGVKGRSQSEALRGNWLFIPEEDAATLDDDVFWIHDIIGMQVVDITGRILGTVHNIMPTGANDVYLIDPAEGVNRGQEILLPAITEVVQSVDPEQRRMIVSLIPGLIDDDSEETSNGDADEDSE